MIWADKIAIAWGALIFLVLFVMWASAGQVTEFFVAAISLSGLKLIVQLVLPVWVFLRILAFLFHRRPSHRGP